MGDIPILRNSGVRSLEGTFLRCELGTCLLGHLRILLFLLAFPYIGIGMGLTLVIEEPVYEPLVDLISEGLELSLDLCLSAHFPGFSSTLLRAFSLPGSSKWWSTKNVVLDAEKEKTRKDGGGQERYSRN